MRPAGPGPAHRPLNDTGQDQCYNGSALVACTAANTGDASPYPRQDGRFGRDRAGMAKVGGGAAGFDFSCVRWDGSVDNSASCITTLTANTTAGASGTPGTDWACTKDNHTNLIWSLQTVNSITWNNATSTAGGSPIATHNSANRCGLATGWRVPTRRELLSIVHYGVTIPAIDVNYFPGTAVDFYWANDSFASVPAIAWTVDFADGNANGTFFKTSPFFVRLVRSGP